VLRFTLLAGHRSQRLKQHTASAAGRGGPAVASLCWVVGGTDDLQHLISDWPGTHALVIADQDHVLGVAGDPDQVARIGPAGATVRHLLAHASGLPFEGDEPVSPVGARRIYSNTGIEVLADHLSARAGMDYADYLGLGVLEPLGLGDVGSTGSPAHGLRMSVNHLVRFGRELLAPTLIDPATLELAITPTYPQLNGVLPGFGAQDPNDWGLGFELRGAKEPHWTAPLHSPATFGHFGGAGSFLWVDPQRRLIGATVGDTGFDDWAKTAWPQANAALLDRYSP